MQDIRQTFLERRAAEDRKEFIQSLLALPVIVLIFWGLCFLTAYLEG